jgi:hypothetical protein
VLAAVLFHGASYDAVFMTYLRILSFAHVEWGVTRRDGSFDLDEVLWFRALPHVVTEVASVDKKAC